MTEEEKIKLILREKNNLNLEFSQESLGIIIKAHGDIINSLFESKTSLDEWEVYLETLVLKMIFTTNTLLQISKGNEVSTLKHPTENHIIDRSSIYILARSIIEIFLTLEYLYFNDKSIDEKKFHYNLWRVSGFISRHNIIGKPQAEFEEKINKEKEEINRLKAEIKKSPFYTGLKKRGLLETYGLPRSISWGELLKQSIITNTDLIKSYGFYSNYAHSEFLSVMQLNEGGLSSMNPHNRGTINTALFMIRLINCVTIILLTDKWNFAKSAYLELEEELRFSIEFGFKLAASPKSVKY